MCEMRVSGSASGSVLAGTQYTAVVGPEREPLGVAGLVGQPRFPVEELDDGLVVLVADHRGAARRYASVMTAR